jgi:hypothetical protein
MKIRFLGKESEYRDSPTLYATERCTYLVQGWKGYRLGDLDQTGRTGE